MSDQQNPVASEQPQTALALPKTREQALSSLMGADENPFFCSFDPKTPEGAPLFFKIAQTADVDLTEMSNMEVELEHLYAANAVKIDPATGAEIELVRIVLLDKFGKSYGCFSQGIRKAINLMTTCYGLPPWKPAVKVTVKLEKLKNGRNWLTLYPVPIIPAGNEPSKRKTL